MFKLGIRIADPARIDDRSWDAYRHFSVRLGIFGRSCAPSTQSISNASAGTIRFIWGTRRQTAAQLRTHQSLKRPVPPIAASEDPPPPRNERRAEVRRADRRQLRSASALGRALGDPHPAHRRRCAGVTPTERAVTRAGCALIIDSDSRMPSSARLSVPAVNPSAFIAIRHSPRSPNRFVAAPSLMNQRDGARTS